MRLLVTGGTGLLGNNIIRQALQDGHQVVAIVRSPTDASLSGLALDVIQGKITNKSEVAAAAEKVDAIVHSAAQIHIGWKCLDESMQTNVQSTQAVVDVALAKGIPLVHVSTVNTLAIPAPHQVADESTEGDGQIPCSYVLSKRASERVVAEGVAQGLQGMIVHPGFMLGPYDWKPSSGRMILGIAKTWTPLAPSGGCSVCDVRDVAKGTLLALTRGKAGGHYILAGENLTYFDLWCRIARELGKRGPISVLRKPGQWVVGSIGDIASMFARTEPDINSAAIRMSGQYHWYSSQKACDELGYKINSADQAIVEAVDWIRNHFL